ncbi:MAG: hypothetical protein ABIQ15_06505 [Nocardioides sp.]
MSSRAEPDQTPFRVGAEMPVMSKPVSSPRRNQASSTNSPSSS